MYPDVPSFRRGPTYTTALAQLFVQGHLKVEGDEVCFPLCIQKNSESYESLQHLCYEPPVPFRNRPCLPPVRRLSTKILWRGLIRIIMDATGFNREEIQPDMELRRDLSIRSSRLPIIMDAAERQFGITIELEDFIGVRTVKDIAERISMVIAREGGTGLQPAAKAYGPDPVRDGSLMPSEDEASLKRLVFNHATVESAASIPMELSPGESVLLLSPDRDDGIAGRAGTSSDWDYGVDTFPMLFMQGNIGPGVEGHDIRTDEGASRAVNRIAGLSPLAGVVIALHQGGSGRLKSMADVSRLLRGLFLLLRHFFNHRLRNSWC